MSVKKPHLGILCRCCLSGVISPIFSVEFLLFHWVFFENRVLLSPKSHDTPIKRPRTTDSRLVFVWSLVAGLFLTSLRLKKAPSNIGGDGGSDFSSYPSPAAGHQPSKDQSQPPRGYATPNPLNKHATLSPRVPVSSEVVGLCGQISSSYRRTAATLWQTWKHRCSANPVVMTNQHPNGFNTDVYLRRWNNQT